MPRDPVRRLARNDNTHTHMQHVVVVAVDFYSGGLREARQDRGPFPRRGRSFFRQRTPEGDLRPERPALGLALQPLQLPIEAVRSPAPGADSGARRPADIAGRACPPRRIR